MTTSGSVDFTATRNQIIRQAALDLKAVEANAVMSAEMMNDFAFRLNAMVKHWNTKGVHVWTTVEATLFPQPEQVSYQMGPGATDHVTRSYVSTALSADAASGATTITVDSIAGISNGDNIGIVVSDGTIHWTTVSAASGSSVLLAAGLDAAAEAAAKVYAYTSKIGRPLKIVQARRYEASSGRETNLAPMLARLDYQSLSNKATAGTVSQAYYDPGLNVGTLFLWYAPENVSNLINFTWHRPIEDFDTTSDNPDLPQEWITTLISNLANEVKGMFSVPAQKSRDLERKAMGDLADMLGYDREEGSVYFTPDIQ